MGSTLQGIKELNVTVGNMEAALDDLGRGLNGLGDNVSSTNRVIDAIVELVGLDADTVRAKVAENYRRGINDSAAAAMKKLNDDVAAGTIEAKETAVNDGDLVVLSFRSADGQPQVPERSVFAMAGLIPDIRVAVTDQPAGTTVPLPGKDGVTITVVGAYRRVEPAQSGLVIVPPSA